MSASSSLPLHLWRLTPDQGLPAVPEMLEGMQLARKKGHEVFILLVEPLEEPEKKVLVGYFTIEERQDPDKWDWRLSYLYILPLWRREGIATEVLRVIKREFGTVTTAVPESNLGAQLLLKKAGFFCTRTVQKEKRNWYVFKYPKPEQEQHESDNSPDRHR